jgi:uncharacterized protein involved in exopolysaccharide biosynthesis
MEAERDAKIVGPVSPLNPGTAGDEVNLVDVLILLARRKKRIAYITGGATLLAIAVSLALPNTYTATTRLLPPQKSQSAAAALLAQLNPLAAGLGADLRMQNPADLYVTLLKSRFVADALIQRFDLRKVYKSKKTVDARERLADVSKLKVMKEGVIEISVEDRDPKRAAQIANAYVDALQDLTQNLAVTEASQRRFFYEHELVAAKEKLSDAEVALKETQEKTGLIQLDEQAKAMIQSAALLRAQITAKEVQVRRMRLFATEQNPDLQGAEQELLGLRSQLAMQERKGGGKSDDLQIATGKVPAAGLEYIRRLRDVKYAEAIFELLSKQFEAAKLDEANDATIIQVIDKAVEPERKSGPKRAMIVMGTAFLSFAFAIFWVLVQDYYERLRKNPEWAAREHLFRTYLRGEDKVQA